MPVKTIFCGDGEIVGYPSVSYRLVVEDGGMDRGTQAECRYGVEICMGELSERENFLTDSLEEAREFVALLRRCLVTPVTLHDIADDWRTGRLPAV